MKSKKLKVLIIVVLIAIIVWSALTAFDIVPSLNELFAAYADKQNIIYVELKDGINTSDLIG